jgi:hypothetical protein
MVDKDPILNNLYALEFYQISILLLKEPVAYISLSSYFRNKMTYEIYCFLKDASSLGAFGLTSSTKRQGNMLSTVYATYDPTLKSDCPRSKRSAVATWMVCA